MSPALKNVLRFVAIAGLALLGACNMQADRPAPRPVSFNPPAAALTTLPASNIVWYHVEFNPGSTRIRPAEVINQIRQARQALGAGDRASAIALIDRALAG